MKKFVPIALLLIVALTCVKVSTAPASAAGESFPDLVGESNGADLKYFDVKLTYRNYILSSSGAYRAIEIAFDRNFAATLPQAEGDATPDYLAVFGPYLQNLGYNEKVDKVNYTIKGERKFDTLTDMYIALGLDGYEPDKSDLPTQKSFYFIDTFNKQNSPFAGIEEEDNVLNAILKEFYNLGITRERILLNYTYGTPYKIIKTDADQTTYSASESLYLHSYDMNMDMSGRQIYLVQHTPNPVGWYTTAIIIAVVVISIPVAIFLINKRKHKEVYHG